MLNQRSESTHENSGTAGYVEKCIDSRGLRRLQNSIKDIFIADDGCISQTISLARELSNNDVIVPDAIELTIAASEKAYYQ